MRCHVCGHQLVSLETDMPFKVSERTIGIVKTLPLWHCPNCGEHVIDDAVMARVEAILARVDREAELEIVRFAA